MSDARHVVWLRSQLSDWVEQGLVSSEAAEALRARYPEPRSRSRRLAVVALGALAATLVGSGIILLLAHNWEELSRTARAAISLVPLAVSLLPAGWTLLMHKGAAWRESVGVFWTFAVGTALALLEQTYHVGGEPEGLMLRWLLLVLPIAYLLRSVCVASLSALGIAIWTPMAFDLGRGARADWGLALLLLLVPFVVQRLREAKLSPGTSVLGWALAVALLPVALFTFVGLDGPWFVCTALAVLAGYTIVDRVWSEPGTSLLQRPWMVAGRAGTVAMLLALSFGEATDLLGRFDAPPLQELVAYLWPVTAVGLGLAAVAWRLRAPWRKDALWLAVPGLAFAAFVLGEAVSVGAAVALINGILLVLGLSGVLQGFRSDSLLQLNVGMAILSLLAVVRFFDSEIDFTIRGAAFIVVGALFFAINVALQRRRRAAQCHS